MARKYHNRIVKDRDGNTFHSAGELARWRELLLLKSAGKIKDLERQVSIPLEIICQPKDDYTVRSQTIKYDNGRVAKLIVDFLYFDNERKTWVYEDHKGFETQVSKLKRAVVRSMGIEVMVTR